MTRWGDGAHGPTLRPSLPEDHQVLGGQWLRELRAELLGDVSGDVVEIGAGTGLNLEHYGPGVRSLVLTEASPYMIARLGAAAERLRPAARVVEAPAEALPLAEASVDCVVSTLVLCSVEDEGKAIAEVVRAAGRNPRRSGARGEHWEGGEVAADRRACHEVLRAWLSRNEEHAGCPRRSRFRHLGGEGPVGR